MMNTTTALGVIDVILAVLIFFANLRIDILKERVIELEKKK